MANDYYYHCKYHQNYHCHFENQCHPQVELLFVWYFSLLFHPRKHPGKRSPFVRSSQFFFNLILLVWCGAFSLGKRILFFFIHNRNNRSISVRTASEYYQFVRNLMKRNFTVEVFLKNI